jgi:hypothetical protein
MSYFIIIVLVIIAIYVMSQPDKATSAAAAAAANTIKQGGTPAEAADVSIAVQAAAEDYKSKPCWIPRESLVYPGCGYTYRTDAARRAQCGLNATGTSKFIPVTEKGACGLSREQTIYSGCGYTYETLEGRNTQCTNYVSGAGTSSKWIGE